MLAARLQQARIAAGLSLRDLAELAGVSAMAISKYERGEIKPSSDVLLRLAKALDVRVEYFFRQTEVELADVDFRKDSKLPKKEELRILADVREHIERWIELESFVPASWPKPFELPRGLPKKVETYEAIEGMAIQLRVGWKLGSNPIRDLIEELEEEGIKVILTPHDGDMKFDGLVAKANGQPVIVVGKSWPGDRQRFTLAHELGHLVLKDRLSKKLDEEKACHRFAGAFLVPKHEAIKALGQSRSWLEPRELHLLKHEWGLSMNAWLHRAQDLHIVNQSTAAKLWTFFRAQGWRENEPGNAYSKECATRFPQMVYRALAEELIGEPKAAELLGISVSALQAHRRMEAGDEARCQ